jgi:hypothetical protein
MKHDVLVEEAENVFVSTCGGANVVPGRTTKVRRDADDVCLTVEP